jgi:hypothetical protein
VTTQVPISDRECALYLLHRDPETLWSPVARLVADGATVQDAAAELGIAHSASLRVRWNAMRTAAAPDIVGRMAARGWLWDGDFDGDPEGRFTKYPNVTVSWAGALSVLRGWRPRGDDLGRGV